MPPSRRVLSAWQSYTDFSLLWLKPTPISHDHITQQQQAPMQKIWMRDMPSLSILYNGQACVMLMISYVAVPFFT